MSRIDPMHAHELITIDSKDKKILHVIDLNARASIAEISRETGIQRDSVLYRMRRMQQAGVIKYYQTILNPIAIGRPIYAFVNFSLHNHDEELERKFIGFLQEHQDVPYVAKLTGKWDITITVAAKDLLHYDAIISEIRKHFSIIIHDFESSSIIEEFKYDRMTGLLDD